MRSWEAIAGKAIVALAAAAAVLLGQPLVASRSSGASDRDPLQLNIVGLDSDDLQRPAERLPGGRACSNSGTDPMNVAVNWSSLSSNTYVDLTNTASFSAASLGAGAYRDYYFDIQVTRNASAYNAARRFEITATGDAAPACRRPRTARSTSRSSFAEPQCGELDRPGQQPGG